MFNFLAYIFVLLFYVICNVNCANILAIIPFPNTTQYYVAKPYLHELQVRGHKVDFFSYFIKDEGLPNIEVVYEDFKLPFTMNMEKGEISKTKWLPINKNDNAITSMLESSNFQKLITQKKVKYDLIIIDTLMPRVLYGLGEHFKANLVALAHDTIELRIDNLVRNEIILSYIPLNRTGLNKINNLFDHCFNMKMAFYEWLDLISFDIATQLNFMASWFSEVKTTFDFISRNFALVLVNQHFSIGIARPYVPNMIEVGGMYIDNLKETISDDVLNFINSAEENVIYMNMGADYNTTNFKKEQIQHFLNFTKTLKHKILWKLDNIDVLEEALPNNVLVREWFPQQAILAHPKVTLFITQAGYLSIMETIHFGKPIVAIPFLHHQKQNFNEIQKHGIGISIPLENLTNDSLTNAVNMVLENQNYTMNMRKLQKRFLDRSQPPMETAIYWTEYILRHNGAEFMRIPVDDMAWFTYNNIDILFSYIIISFLFLYVSIKFNYQISDWISEFYGIDPDNIDDGPANFDNIAPAPAPSPAASPTVENVGPCLDNFGQILQPTQRRRNNTGRGVSAPPERPRGGGAQSQVRH